jgi:hypothetical protein
MKVNGSLAFDASSASEIKNLRVEKYAAMPGYTPGQDHGRLIYNSTTSVLSFGSDTIGGGSWVATATGGTAFSQAEGDAIEASLGAGINTDGTFNAAGFPAQAGLSTPTSFTNAINQIAAYATANNTLYELDDVTLSAAVPTGAKFLFTAGNSNWLDHTLVLADVSNVTATALELNELHLGTAVQADFIKLHNVTSTAVELNVLTGIVSTLTAGELSFVDGVTSGIQGQLDNKQPLDAGLTSLASLTGPGFVTVDATGNIVSSRTFVNPAAGFTLSNLDGSGNPTFALANDLAALEGLATTGYIVRTADGGATTRSFSTVAADIVITGDAAGITTDTTFGLAPVTQAATGDFRKITLDSKGRVVGNTAVVLADITALTDATYVNVIGDTMSGNLIMGTNFVTMDSVPTLDNQGANKAYVDAVAAGLSWKQAVNAATVANVALATITAGSVLDGITLIAGNRVLVKDQTAPAENGIYVVQAAGAPVRDPAMDTAAEFNGATVFVLDGTINDNSGWTQTSTVTTIGTSPVVWTQFSGSSTYTWGTGLGSSGNTIYVNLGAGISELPTDEIGLDIVPNKAVQLSSVAAGGQLTFMLDGAGLEQSTAGLKISALGVTNDMLVHSQFTLNGDTGTDALILGDTLQIKGTPAQGVSTATTESPAGTSSVTISVADASYTQKGVAQFASADFAVVAGVVSIAAISNAQLDNSTITITDSVAGSDPVALGESFAIIGDGAAISTAMGANSLVITARKATASLTGVASFAAANFAVDVNGAVTLASSLDALSNVSAADAAATNSLLQKSAGDWVAVTPAAVGATITLGDLQDVGIAPATTAGQALIADGSAWQAAKIYHLHTQAVASTSWTVTHGIGQKYCNVTIVDSTDEVVIPQSIKFDGTTSLTVTFNTAIAGKVVVMGIV